MKPARIQLRRTKGWRMPANTVSAARPGPMGNPWTVAGAREAGYSGDDRRLAAYCVQLFREWVEEWPGSLTGMLENSDALRTRLNAKLATVRGKNLGCWCRLCDRHKDGKPFDEQCGDCAPCHTDVLGPRANA